MVRKEKEKFYFVCVHPLACFFGDIVYNRHKRAFASIVMGFVLSLLAKVQPICTEDLCYDFVAQMFLNPGLFFKPFAFEYIFVPMFFSLMLLTIIWFVILTILSSIHRTGKVNEIVIPVVAILIFVYMAFLVSGTLGPIFLHTGLVECIEDEDCIRAGYVGEVCASVYRPVYTEYSPDLKPLETCGCFENKCVGS